MFEYLLSKKSLYKKGLTMIWKLITGTMTLLLVAMSLLFLNLFEAFTLKNAVIVGLVGVGFIMVLVFIDVFTHSQSNSKSNSRTLKNVK